VDRKPNDLSRPVFPRRRCDPRTEAHAEASPAGLIAGGGEQLTLRALARLADACNVGGDVDTVRHKLTVLRRHCDAARRDYDAIEKTHNNSCLILRDSAAVAAKRERLAARGPLRGFVGTVSEAIDVIGQYQDAGIQLLINSD
jgi:alkanesulfonate monooxygenase SsuD/methylene tetrahydromethanopterin reductase-like flavin-dependent oxidoreductase (luciferase family)